MDYIPMLQVNFDTKANGKEIETETVNVEEFIGIKGYKAKGKRLSNFVIKKLKWLEPLPYEHAEEELSEDVEEIIEATDETEVADQNTDNENNDDNTNEGGEQMSLGL